MVQEDFELQGTPSTVRRKVKDKKLLPYKCQNKACSVAETWLGKECVKNTQYVFKEGVRVRDILLDNKDLVIELLATSVALNRIAAELNISDNGLRKIIKDLRLNPCGRKVISHTSLSESMQEKINELFKQNAPVA